MNGTQSGPGGEVKEPTQQPRSKTTKSQTTGKLSVQKQNISFEKPSNLPTCFF